MQIYLGRYILLALLFTGITLSKCVQHPEMKNGDRYRWSEEKANAWYDKQQWPCGFNYIPANAISYTEMWMPYSFNPALIDKELALAEDISFNVLPVVLPFVVWEHDPEAFLERLDT